MLIFLSSRVTDEVKKDETGQTLEAVSVSAEVKVLLHQVAVGGDGGGEGGVKGQNQLLMLTTASTADFEP